MSRDYNLHAFKLGKLVGNLLTIEMIARIVVQKKDDAKKNIDLERQLVAAVTGDVIELSAYSEKNDLRGILDKYNKRVSVEYKIETNSLVDLRDALAHGRVFGFSGNDCLKLIKFNRKYQNGRVVVDLSVEMTDNWFDSNNMMLEKSISKMIKSIDYEKRSLK